MKKHRRLQALALALAMCGLGSAAFSVRTYAKPSMARSLATKCAFAQAERSGGGEGSACVFTGKLPGGGSFIVQRRAGIPVAAVELWYRAPSVGFGATPIPSLARLAAEVVVASKPITGKPLGALVTDLGGRTSINVYADSVTISALVPASCAPQIVKAMTTAFFAPVITEDGYHEALHAVEQEALLNSFNPDDVARDVVFGAIFGDGPAHYPVLSDPQSVEKISLDAIRLFAMRAFRSQNALLVVDGSVDPAISANAVAGRSPESASSPEAASEPAASSQLASPSPRVVTKTLDEQGGAYGWVGPPISSENEATAMDFIADYLFRPDAGVVTKELVDAQQGASVAGQFITLHNPGVFLVSYTAKDTAQAEKLIDRGLATMRTPLSKEAFATLLDAFEYHLLSDLQTPLALADNFGWYAVEGNPEYAPGIDGDRGMYFRQLHALTPDFVAHVAQKYLDKPSVRVQFIPSSPAPKPKGAGTS